MGLFDTIFGTTKPKVDERNFDKMMNQSGLNSREKGEVSQIFKGSINEEGHQQKGLDAEEARQGLELLKKGKEERLHNIPDEKIQRFEKQLGDKFRWQKEEPKP
ncbi:MAG: hypothetical protein Q8Q06_02595 [bacterium]|nr:hypothetical protein [bacterium]